MLPTRAPASTSSGNAHIANQGLNVFAAARSAAASASSYLASPLKRIPAAHSACVGFGLERVALALFKTHGLKLSAWPREVRDVLALG